MVTVKNNKVNNKTRDAEYAFGVALSFFILNKGGKKWILK